VTSFYAGPDRGYLKVDSWDELVAAVQAGSTTESQWIECKKAIPARSPDANIELAKDLASLTVDGGVLVIGVKDKASTAEGVVGTDDDIDGLKDRITSIASGPRVMPPMQVIIGSPIPHPDDQSRYALLVSVPQSASAPHMVAEQYWGRSAVGKRPLNDAEVATLFAERRLATDNFEAKLRAISNDLDPVPAVDRKLVHFSVFVRPEMPAHDNFIKHVDEGGRFRALLTEARQRAFYRTDRYPSLIDLDRRYAHQDGPAWEGTVKPPSDSDKPFDVASAEIQYMRLLIGSDGAISVAAARGSNPLTDGGTEIDLAYIVVMLHQAMSLAGVLGRGVMAFHGMWRVGVHVNNMRGHLGYAPAGYRSEKGQPFAIAEYVRTATASTADLAGSPVPIIDRVLRGLARASGLKGDLAQYMDPETSPLM
jgi:hypothetical protein